MNQPEVFGYQAVVDADDNVEELEWRLLSAPTRLTLREVGKHIHELGGLFIAAHIDRAVFSVTSQLGGLFGDEGFDAVELTRYANLEEWRDKTSRAAGDPLIRCPPSRRHRHHLEGEADLFGFFDTGIESGMGLLVHFSALVLPCGFER